MNKEQKFKQIILEILQIAEVNMDVDWDFAETTPEKEWEYITDFITEALEEK